jgi:hypothetical protein
METNFRGSFAAVEKLLPTFLEKFFSSSSSTSICGNSKASE